MAVDAALHEYPDEHRELGSRATSMSIRRVPGCGRSSRVVSRLPWPRTRRVRSKLYHHNPETSRDLRVETPAELDENAANMQLPIHTDLWTALKQAGLLHPEAPTPA